MEGVALKFIRAEKFGATQIYLQICIFFFSNNSIPLNESFVRRIQNLFKRLETLLNVSQKILTCT